MTSTSNIPWTRRRLQLFSGEWPVNLFGSHRICPWRSVKSCEESCYISWVWRKDLGCDCGLSSFLCVWIDKMIVLKWHSIWRSGESPGGEIARGSWQSDAGLMLLQEQNFRRKGTPWRHSARRDAETTKCPVTGKSPLKQQCFIF